MIKVMKRIFLFLLCFMLVFSPALAEETVSDAPVEAAADVAVEGPVENTEEVVAEVERTRILIYQGVENTGVPQAELAVLAAVPDLSFDYVVFYDQSHVSVCDLTTTTSYEERRDHFLAWCEVIGKDTYRNAAHSSPWEALLQPDTPLDPSVMDVVWVTAYDAVPEDVADLTALISRLVACGGTLHVLDASNGTVLQSAMAMLVNTQLTHVDTITFHVVDLLMKEAGYLHVNDELMEAMVRSCEVHPSDGMSGQTLLVETTPYYQLIGGEVAYQGLSFSYAPSTQGVAILPSDPSEEEMDGEQPSVEGEYPFLNHQSNYAITSGEEPAVDENGQPVEDQAAAEPVDQLTLLLQELFAGHQICWYFKPVDELSINAQADMTTIPHGTNEQITVRMSLTAAQEAPFESALCAANLTDAAARYQLGAAVVDERGQAYEAAIAATEEPGIYDIVFDRLTAGNYTLKTAVRWNGMDYQFNAFETPIVFEAPLAVSARPQKPVQLMVSPLLWHDLPSTVTIEGATLFNGSFEPIQCLTAQDEWAKATAQGASVEITAIKEGKTSLLFVAADGESKVIVPVHILNGRNLIVAEGIALLAALLLVLYIALFTRSHKPRFRYNEQLHIDIDGNHAAVVPLKKYLASGVTMWRLLVVGGCAKAYASDSAYLKRIRLMPKLDRIIVKNQKAKEELIAYKEYTLRSDSHTYVVTLKTQD